MEVLLKKSIDSLCELALANGSATLSPQFSGDLKQLRFDWLSEHLR